MVERERQSEILRFASQVAHQLRGPLSTVTQLLRAMQQEHAGPLSAQQQDILLRALNRSEQAVETAHRMMAIGEALGSPRGPAGPVDLVAAVRSKEQEFASVCADRNISLSVQILVNEAWVSIDEVALGEALRAVVDNAFKYTPDNSHVRLVVRPGRAEGTIGVSVADSGVGIPEAEREKVFTPFFRTSTARASGRPGTGLGLAFVKAVVETAGGQVRAGNSDLGGAEFSLDFPAAAAPDPAASEATAGPRPMRMLIIGGAVAGPKAASKIIRMLPNAEVTIVEKEKILTYAGCSLASYVSGQVHDHRELTSTPVGVVRDSVFFQNVKNVRVMDQAEAVEVDRSGGRVQVRDNYTGKTSWVQYDKLLLATGAVPVKLDVPGHDLEGIFRLHGIRDAEGIRAKLSQTRAHDVVIVGGGLIGVEATEAFVRKGCRVAMVENRPQILRQLDWELAQLLQRHMQAHGVKVFTGTRVHSFRGTDRVDAVVTDHGVLPADMVILAAGVRPNVRLAVQAGLEIGPTGAIRVDEHMRTSDADIYAAGDCVETRHIIDGHPAYVPRGSTANRQARVAAVNMAGGEDTFPGVLGSTVCKVFDFCVGWTGLNERRARELGYDPVCSLAPAPDKAHFMPDPRLVLLKAVADRNTRKLLGCQVTGPGAGDKRLDAAAMALLAGFTIDQIASADLCYAPPYSQALDNIHTAANIIRNKLDGYMDGITPMEVQRLLEERADFVFLDVRSPREYEKVRLAGAKLVPLGALRGRLGELPADKLIVTFCSISLRGYEAALILRAAGFSKVRVMDGGIEMWPYEKLFG